MCFRTHFYLMCSHSKTACKHSCLAVSPRDCSQAVMLLGAKEWYIVRVNGRLIVSVLASMPK